MAVYERQNISLREEINKISQAKDGKA